MARCQSCDASIAFLRMPTGNRMPVDVTPSRSGNVVVLDHELGMARVLTREEYAWWPGPRYMPHWRTCPHADEHRKRRRA